MTIMTQEAKKGLGCVLHWSGESAISGTYDDDGNKRGFLILPDGVTVTPSGTFTTQKMKDGRNIWKFDGSTNYVSLSDHDAWDIWNGDTTITLWIKFNNTLVSSIILYQAYDANNRWGIFYSSTGYLNLYGNVSGSKTFYYQDQTFTPLIDTWYHITIQRSGSSCIIFVNGIPKSVTVDTAFTGTTTIVGSLEIGRYHVTSVYANGNIKDLMIFKGKALTQDQIAAIMKETYIY